MLKSGEGSWCVRTEGGWGRGRGLREEVRTSCEGGVRSALRSALRKGGDPTEAAMAVEEEGRGG